MLYNDEMKMKIKEFTDKMEEQQAEIDEYHHQMEQM